MRIAIYGIGNCAENFYNMLESRSVTIEIVYFVQTEKTESVFHGKKVVAADEMDDSDFDKLVIASDIYFYEIIEHLKSLAIGYNLYKKAVRYNEFLLKEWEDAGDIMPYRTCKIKGGISYVARSEDGYMPGSMFRTGKNYAENLIQDFFKLTEKYYGQSILDSKGIFLDIGANLGTTSIYVKKMMNRALHVIGFEPAKVNYDLFRVNCILNQVEDIKTEFMGLSSDNVQKSFFYSVSQSGLSRIVEDNAKGENINVIEVMKLDDYLDKNKISAEQIDYIWIDAEGHEDEIIEGAMKTLRSKKIPLIHECNPGDYLEKNRFDIYCKNVAEIYNYFIDMKMYRVGEMEPIPISQINSYGYKIMETKTQHTDLFFF